MMSSGRVAWANFLGEALTEKVERPHAQVPCSCGAESILSTRLVYYSTYESGIIFTCNYNIVVPVKPCLAYWRALLVPVNLMAG